MSGSARLVICLTLVLIVRCGPTTPAPGAAGQASSGDGTAQQRKTITVAAQN